MAVTTAQIKELRELSGAGMLDCKNALVETDGDVKAAVDWLREKGLAAAAKKAGRIASEGIVQIAFSEDGNTAVVVEVNSETDFVAKNEVFRTFVEQVAKQLIASPAKDTEAFFEEKWEADSSLTVKEALSSKIAVIGENLNIRRFERVTKGEGEIFASYIHGEGKMGVLLEMTAPAGNAAALEAGRNICMQIAAMYPKYISRGEISAEYIDKERAILLAAAQNDETLAKKPPNVIAGIVEGRLSKSLKEACLLEQEYVRDTSLTVEQYVASVSKEIGAPVALKRFVSFEKGEGIEKKQEDFAEEVRKAIG